jgi:hypothetical protein
VIRHLTHPMAVILTLAGLPLAPRPAVVADDWQSLGRSQVSFAAEKDVIEVGVREGLFDAIRIDVQGGDIELYNIRVVFGNGTSWSPNTRVAFREGSRSRVIDLPGEARIIRRIEFWYRSRIRRGRATVEVFGRPVHPGGGGGPGGGPGQVAGWDHIGMQQVDFRGDHDVIRLTGAGRFRSIRFVVEGGDIQMYGVRITFGNGETFSPPTRLSFSEGSRSREIDLPGATRNVRRIDFSYRTVRGGRRGGATVHVYGRR